ncbi:hypothetical protein WA026_004282 [Henosepilachna vigintioctopunctata]|uniref:Uncharacterized protein n=1 Tax=Henosepilachna vigintioctopunctata TaxID=420089 RepID=A0AAW1V1P7_9CUCU
MGRNSKKKPRSRSLREDEDHICSFSSSEDSESDRKMMRKVAKQTQQEDNKQTIIKLNVPTPNRFDILTEQELRDIEMTTQIQQEQTPKKETKKLPPTNLVPEGEKNSNLSKMEAKRAYTAQEIKQIAPGYRGKPENFDPTRKEKVERISLYYQKKRNKMCQRKVVQVHQNYRLIHIYKINRQRNETRASLLSIFGIDVSVTPISPREQFSANYLKVINLSQETLSTYQADETQLDYASNAKYLLCTCC